MTPPLTPPDSELRDFAFMPLDVVRLAQSDLVAFEEPAAVVAAILLWGAAWHGKPAGSLTNDDRALAKAAGYGRGIGEWLGVKEGALRGFVECSDGRLYHPVVAEKVREAWAGKLRQRHRTFLAAVRKHNERNPNDQRDGPTYEAWDALGRPKEVAALTAPRPQQPRLALSGGDADRFADEETAPMSHATPANVTRDTGGMSRDQDPHVTQDSGSKGEGQGQGQGQGQGDSYNNNNRGARERDDDVGIDPFDVIATTDALARRGGVPHTQPSSINRNVEMVRQWLKDGIDLAETVVPVIDEFRLDNPEQPVHSLRLFDTGVRAKVAGSQAKERREARKPRGKAVEITPLRVQDQDDPRVATIRAQLNGHPGHAIDRIALRLDTPDDDLPILFITLRHRIDERTIDTFRLGRVAEEVVGSRVLVRVEAQ